MAKRYKGYKTLNKMIDELENTVITVSTKTGDAIKPNIVTKKSPSARFNIILNEKTGKFLSYKESKEKAKRINKDTPYTYKDYLNYMHEFQDTPLVKQLTLKGEMEYHIERAEKVFGKSLIDDIIESIGYSNYREAIDRIGRLSNDLSEKSSKYDSNTFYDMFDILMEQIENGVDILDALDNIESIFDVVEE